MAKRPRGTKVTPKTSVTCDCQLDKIGTATVLFALRYLQGNYDDSGYVVSEHVKDTACSPLSEDEVGRLAELINTKTVLIP